MVTALQIILLFILFISFVGVFVERDKETQVKVFAMFLASLTAFIVSVLWL